MLYKDHVLYRQLVQVNYPLQMCNKAPWKKLGLNVLTKKLNALQKT